MSLIWEHTCTLWPLGCKTLPLGSVRIHNLLCQLKSIGPTLWHKCWWPTISLGLLPDLVLAPWACIWFAVRVSFPWSRLAAVIFFHLLSFASPAVIFFHLHRLWQQNTVIFSPAPTLTADKQVASPITHPQSDPDSNSLAHQIVRHSDKQSEMSDPSCQMLSDVVRCCQYLSSPPLGEEERLLEEPPQGRALPISLPMVECARASPSPPTPPRWSPWHPPPPTEQES